MKNELKRYSDSVIWPYQPSAETPVDILVHINIFPEYGGSGRNFFVNFPGFLIWAPAWAGYKYRVRYLFAVTLRDVRKNQSFDKFEIPISLDVRQAEFDRTWTEISWFEVGVIAFIGGIYFTGYDPDITPKVVDAAQGTIADYVAGEIITRINASGRFS